MDSSVLELEGSFCSVPQGQRPCPCGEPVTSLPEVVSFLIRME
jgi:hypothetical protein